jgi:hypothetical protein
MSIGNQLLAPSVTCEKQRYDCQRRSDYASEFSSFSSGLTGAQRKTAAGAAKADWDGRRTFALPVTSDHPAFSTDPDDPIVVTLDELAAMKGALPKIALWLNDKIGIDAVLVQERLRLVVARICDAKYARLEAHLVSLAIGLNLSVNANGFAIAQHFGLTPQTFHEKLGDTCTALGLPKPLAKVKKDRYRKTQYSHSLRKPKAS